MKKKNATATARSATRAIANANPAASVTRHVNVDAATVKKMKDPHTSVCGLFWGWPKAWLEHTASRLKRYRQIRFAARQLQIIKHATTDPLCQCDLP